jgi:mRNA interferase MazF
MEVAKPGDVLIVNFPGVTGMKRRPVVAVSTDAYHAARPDTIVAVQTSQVTSATAPTDYILQDWEDAHLHRPTAFRAFLATVTLASGTVVGHLSERDWSEVQGRLRLALAVS